MDYLKYSTVEEEIPIKSILKEGLVRAGLVLYECEGIAKTMNGGLTIFERVEILDPNQVSNKSLLKDACKLISQRNSMDVKLWYSFLSGKNGGIYLLLHDSSCQHFIVSEYETKSGEFKKIKETNCCKDLSDFLYGITHKNVRKKFIYNTKMKCIDKCLRDNGVPHPGNLDGIVLEQTHEKITPKLILEFSKVNYASFEKHRSIYEEKYLAEDANRWEILSYVSKVLDVPAGIIWWHPEDYKGKCTQEKDCIMIGRLINENGKAKPKFGDIVHICCLFSFGDLLKLVKEA